MRYILLFAGVLFFCNCRTPNTFTHNTNASDTLIRFNTWGLPYFKALGIIDSVNSKWGFYEDNVMGCIVTKAEIDSLTRDNEIAARPLVARYGSNWHKKYSKELHIALATPGLMTPSIYFNEEVTKKREELQLVGDTLFYHFKRTRAIGTYNVDVVGWQRQGTEKKWVSYYRYRLSYKKPIPKLITRKIRTDTVYLHNNIYFSEDSFDAYLRD
ncbi:hypothetical protein [Chitinophaga ginsengisoli]|uniref:Uncharacterized protein n=1 Tax=Chitinophaga ginsengisoli TaxID=363837 RepID=A0A2P8GLK8_9BACT|nr:hypothetical protein [Chitinophaga ginsengisoli]PSL34846.1 hypothetical protein CLV42_102419 [Chitinophaga ginsengisoli]